MHPEDVLWAQRKWQRGALLGQRCRSASRSFLGRANWPTCHGESTGKEPERTALAPQVCTALRRSFLAPSCAPPALLTSVFTQLVVVPARGRGAGLCRELLSVPSELPCTTSSSLPCRGGAEAVSSTACQPLLGQRSHQEPLPSRAVEESLCLTGRECQRAIPPAGCSGDSLVTFTPP